MFLSVALALLQVACLAAMLALLVKQTHVNKPGAVRDTPLAGGKDSRLEMENLKKQRAIRLTVPLSEQVRPRTFDDIVGQDEGVEALMAMLCGPNPQHVIIYGPPGTGKTCAARLVLEAAKQRGGTPFRPDAPFVEIDATCVRFDERAIADPLIGSVHDPIYQGAGQLGVAGVPQPKPGAVTKAHGGVLFLDEIGELVPIQMNKLLKVLEDRSVHLESAYYNPHDTATPRHIHDIFQNGLPADFRLVGATTRSPQEIPPAIRSRCMEVFFRGLTRDEVALIAKNAAERAGYPLEPGAEERVGLYAEGGRDATNIVQVAAGLACMHGRKGIRVSDVEWVAKVGGYSPHSRMRLRGGARVGCVHGLAVAGAAMGSVLPIEAIATSGTGVFTVTGIVDEEEMGGAGHTIKRKSMAHASAQNVRTVLRAMGLDIMNHDVHINFPGGTPIDGPSAGVAMALAAWSALTGCPIDGTVAVTGELSVTGEVLPVGGVPLKIEAAERGGARLVLIPADNWQAVFEQSAAKVQCVHTFEDAIALMRADRTPPALPEAPVLAIPASVVGS